MSGFRYHFYQIAKDPVAFHRFFDALAGLAWPGFRVRPLTVKVDGPLHRLPF